MNIQKGKKETNIIENSQGPWLGYFICIISFNLHKFWENLLFLFKDGEAESQLH